MTSLRQARNMGESRLPVRGINSLEKTLLTAISQQAVSSPFNAPSLKAKCPAKPGTGAVVAAGEAGWRPVVPVAVERDIPLQIAEIGRAHV
jgi:hypothetical protein